MLRKPIPAAFDAVNKEWDHLLAVVITPVLAIMEDQVKKGQGRLTLVNIE